jgi:integrase
MLGDMSPLTCRSYAFDPLRWFRVLWLVDVGWEQATEAEASALVGWLRSARNPQRERRRQGALPAGSVDPKTGKQTLSAGYAPATIAHNLSVVHAFYKFHMHFGDGPVANPVPEASGRRAALAHRSPIEGRQPHRRARLRPKVRSRRPRAIPDQQWDELFVRMGCDRDRALLSCYVASGTRASELLGLRLGDVNWQQGKLWVVSKGSRSLDKVPVSPQALAYLAAYLDQDGLPEDGGQIWRTRRGPSRPLTYWAARRIIQRAVEALGSNWTLHDLRHTVAQLNGPGWTRSATTSKPASSKRNAKDGSAKSRACKSATAASRPSSRSSMPRRPADPMRSTSACRPSARSPSAGGRRKSPLQLLTRPRPVVQRSVPGLTRRGVRPAGRSDNDVMLDRPSACGCARR